MHQNLEEIEVDIIKTGICIVGAGAAGIPLALELEEKGKSVVLLESGGFDYDPEIQELNKGESIGQDYFPLKSSRLRFFGGTTGQWTGQCSTLDEIDFEYRKWVPYSGWPISKMDLNPYYKKAHQILDLSEYEYDVSFWEDKLNKRALSLKSELVETKIYQKSKPTRFGNKYRERITQSKNIWLITNANLTFINLSENGKNVDSIKVSSIEGKTRTVQSDIFVLACGALQNVRHLLNSNDISNKGVGNEFGLVGRFFMEHLHVDTSDLVILANENLDFYFDHSLKSSAFGMITTKSAFQKQFELPNFSARIMAKSDAQSLTVNQSENSQVFLDKWKGLDSRKSKVDRLKSIFGEEGIGNLVDKVFNMRKSESYKEDDKYEISRYILNARSEQVPNPNSRVMLGDSKDRLGVPHVKLDWQLTELDKYSLLKSNIAIGQELGRLGLGRLKLGDWLTKSSNDWPKFLAGGWHHMGITRMSASPETGVVDKNCKVHSLSNLYIAGSGVFPTSGVANPTLTIVALSLRLGDHLNSLLK